MESAGLSFTVVAPDFDERAAETPLLEAEASGAEIAEVLAIGKAMAVSETNGDAIVIGCDQTLCLDDEILHKPRDMEEARRRLLSLSGRTHELNSAIALVRGGETLASDVVTARITFRKLDPGFVGRHLAEVGPDALSSVGAYQIEGRGIQLVERIEGDFLAIVGMPLLTLLGRLRELDMIDH